MEASKTGRGGQQQHVEELVSQYNDALNKLNQLKSLTPDTIQLLATIYNESTIPDNKKSSTTNVFASSNATQQTAQSHQNPFQMGNIFGGSHQQQQTMNTGSIFGSSTTSNPFQSQQTSIFGGGTKEQPPQSTASNFSFSLNHPTQQQSIFGFNQSTQQPQMPSSSIFGAGQTNIFGSTFGAPAQQPPQQTFGSSIFGQSKLSGSTMGLYNQAAQQPPGTFESAQPLQQVTNALGQAQSGSAQNTLFQQLNGNVFNQFQGQTAPQPQNASNPFTQTVLSHNVYAMQQTQQEQQQAPPAPAGSIFHIQQSNPQQVAGENPFQTQAPQIDESVYSRPEDLTPEEIRAFQAGTFTLGQIPLKPPPKQLCL